MPSLQFAPLTSQPDPGFWSALTTRKLDKLKLDDSVQSIAGWMAQGREVVDKEAPIAGPSSGPRKVGIDGYLGIGEGAFREDGDGYVIGSLQLLRFN